MKKVFLLCSDEEITRVIYGNSYKEVYDDTIARDDGQLLFEVEEEVLANLADDAAIAAWNNTRKSMLKNHSGEIPEEIKERMFKWIGWWGDGGGMLSIETAFSENIIGRADTYEDLFENTENDSYFEDATLLFEKVIRTMIIECNEESSMER